MQQPDVYLKLFQSATSQQQVGETAFKGFFAQNNTNEKWILSMTYWFLASKTVVYVNREILQKNRAGCRMYLSGYENLGSFFGGSPASNAKDRFDTANSYTPRYHLFARNCQHFRDWVLTGWHTSLYGT